ncbi:MAG: GNAT family N-acetyltransferase [Rhizobiaceae bacterium]|nr:GNAT family N-acetyltransferase [Rhizobiaceae bacterium]
MNPVTLLENLFVRKAEFDIFPVTMDDCHDMSLLHAERFYRGWDESEFHSLMNQPTAFGYAARPNNGISSLGGFVLGREAAGESEILTIAVSGRYPRQGLGWRLMLAALRDMRGRGAETMFLEVDEGNAAAQGLYRKLGFRIVAERRGYYDLGNGRKSTALVMRLDLR